MTDPLLEFLDPLSGVMLALVDMRRVDPDNPQLHDESIVTLSEELHGLHSKFGMACEDVVNAHVGTIIAAAKRLDARLTAKQMTEKICVDFDVRVTLCDVLERIPTNEAKCVSEFVSNMRTSLVGPLSLDVGPVPVV